MDSEKLAQKISDQIVEASRGMISLEASMMSDPIRNGIISITIDPENVEDFPEAEQVLLSNDILSFEQGGSMFWFNFNNVISVEIKPTTK